METIRLTASSEMILVLVRKISEVLLPLVEGTAVDIPLGFGKLPDGREWLTVTIPDSEWQIPVLDGIIRALFDRQDLIYISGLDRFHDRLFRIPWVVPDDGVLRPPPKGWSHSPAGNLAGVASRPEINQFFCSWIFVSNVVRAIQLAFSQEGRLSDRMAIVHPSVPEEVPYQIYARFAKSWTGSFQFPEHLIEGARILMGEQWRPVMGEWLLGLRPELQFEVVADSGKHCCHITSSGAVIALLEDALLCLGNLVMHLVRTHMQSLLVMPGWAEAEAEALRLHNVNPDPIMLTIEAAILDDLGFRLPPPLEISKAPELCVNRYGGTYLTISGSTPIEPEHLIALRAQVWRAHADIRSRMGWT